MGSYSFYQYAASSGRYGQGTASWTTGPTVTLNVEANGGWRIRGTNSGPYSATEIISGNGSGTYTFNARGNGDKVAFQVYCTVEEQYTNGDIFTITYDDNTSGGDSGGSGGSSGDSYSHYLWIKDVDHVKTKVYRYSGGNYPLVPDSEFIAGTDDDGLWYGLSISNPSYFRFSFEVDSGYTLTNQGIYNLSWDSSDQDWAFRGGEEPYVWPEVTKNSSTPSTPSLPNVSTTQSVYAFIDTGSVWIPVGVNAASLGLANVSQSEIAYALIDDGSSWLPINY